MTGLTSFWWRRQEPWWLELFLWPLTLASYGYAAGAWLSRTLARPVRVSVPVISVGNLTVGGAGKTPVVLAIAERLLLRGRKPAVLSRGYGRISRERCVEVLEDSSADRCGDEPLLIKRRLPALLVLVGPRRALLAEEAVRRGADVILLDDGLQHHALARNLDVVVFDASNPLGNGRLLPRGPLRELPATQARLQRVLTWFTRCEPGRPPLLTGPVVESAFEARAPDSRLRGARAFLFAGVARPASFEDTVRGLGAEVVGTRWFSDHHRFRPGELLTVRREAERAGAGLLVTTEKDFVRLAPGDLSGTLPLVAVPVSLRISRGEEALEEALEKALEAALEAVLPVVSR